MDYECGWILIIYRFIVNELVITNLKGYKKYFFSSLYFGHIGFKKMLIWHNEVLYNTNLTKTAFKPLFKHFWQLSVSDGKINFAKLDEFSFKLTRKVLSSNNPTVVEKSCSEVESIVKKEFPKSFVLSKMNEAQRMDHISNLLLSCKVCVC